MQKLTACNSKEQAKQRIQELQTDSEQLPLGLVAQAKNTEWD